MEINLNFARTSAYTLYCPLIYILDLDQKIYPLWKPIVISATRGHFKNQGGRNSNQRFASTCYPDHFSQFILTRSPEPS